MKPKLLVLGLTGGIGMGKSTAATILSRFGFPIYSADQAVHDLLAKGGAAVKHLSKIFPTALKKGAIDRKVLGKIVFCDPKKLKKLESILHPLVQQKEKEFLAFARKKKAKAVVLEIPLLFETRAERRCDFTLCVTAPKAIQKARVLKRKHMTEEKFKAILKRQMSDAEKRSLADFVVNTGKGYAKTKAELKTILQDILKDEAPY